MNLNEIENWHVVEFGKPSSLGYTTGRALEEMAELVKAIGDGENNESIMKEAADVVIVLTALGQLTGISLQKAIDEKMKINKARRWKPDGKGHGNHIREA